jgi:hypothetical protein
MFFLVESFVSAVAVNSPDSPICRTHGRGLPLIILAMNHSLIDLEYDLGGSAYQQVFR